MDPSEIEAVWADVTARWGDDGAASPAAVGWALLRLSRAAGHP